MMTKLSFTFELVLDSIYNLRYPGSGSGIQNLGLHKKCPDPKHCKGTLRELSTGCFTSGGNPVRNSGKFFVIFGLKVIHNQIHTITRYNYWPKNPQLAPKPKNFTLFLYSIKYLSLLIRGWRWILKATWWCARRTPACRWWPRPEPRCGRPPGEWPCLPHSSEFAASMSCGTFSKKHFRNLQTYEYSLLLTLIYRLLVGGIYYSCLYDKDWSSHPHPRGWKKVENIFT